MAQYDGPERREHCEMHEKNSTDIASIKGSSSSIKWFIGILSGFILLSITVLINTLGSISRDVKQVNFTIQQNALQTAEIKAQLTYVGQRVERLEGMKP